MANIKVKPLDWYMKKDHEDLLEDGYQEVPNDFILLNRDGYYFCAKWKSHKDACWFEINGKGYFRKNQRNRQYFCYSLEINDEAILSAREISAIKELLSVTRDSAVRKVLRSRLQRHEQAVSSRSCGRDSRLARIRILGF